jgi:prepilin-type N-terminal cleavage/methylation domain-containing protein
VGVFRTVALVRSRVLEDGGFTIIEVLVAALILAVGTLALFGMIIASDHAMARDKVRQQETSMAREVLEDARSLPYTDLNPAALASALQPIVPGSTVTGSTLTVTRSIYSFNVALTACSLDSPPSGYGYGNHTLPPASGGSWCPDVGTTGSNPSPAPDDLKRVTATITTVGNNQAPAVEQAILIYARPNHGPAVSCLTTSTAGNNCGAAAQVTTAGTTSLTFNVTTTAAADRVQWLVNGAHPPASEIPSGSTDPYQPSSTGSSFTWNLPYVVVNGTNTYIDGTFTITAVAYDPNGNSGTRSTVQVTINEHTVTPPATVNAGWNSTLHVVDVQWTPSIDQDVLYYQMMDQYGSNAQAQVCQTGNSSITTCTDTSAPAPNNPSPCTYGTDSGTPNFYWVVGWDTNPLTLAPRAGSGSTKVDANACDHPPNTPSGLAVTPSGSNVTLSWAAPAPADPDPGDSIAYWRIYRWSGSGGQALSSRYDVITNKATTYTDTSPDPGGIAQNYCVSAVDTHMNESPCSNVAIQ